MTKKRWTVEDKAKIVIESLTTSANRRHMQEVWPFAQHVLSLEREKFLEGGRAAMAGVPSARATKALQKENDHTQDAGWQRSPWPTTRLKKRWR